MEMIAMRKLISVFVSVLLVTATTSAQAYTAREIYELAKRTPDVAALYIGGIYDAYAGVCWSEGDKESIGYGEFLENWKKFYLLAVIVHGTEAEDQNAAVFTIYVYESAGADTTRQAKRSCAPYEAFKHLAKEATLPAGAKIAVPREIIERYPEIVSLWGG